MSVCSFCSFFENQESTKREAERIEFLCKNRKNQGRRLNSNPVIKTQSKSKLSRRSEIEIDPSFSAVKWNGPEWTAPELEGKSIWKRSLKVEIQGL